jgi:hypothetical protein
VQLITGYGLNCASLLKREETKKEERNGKIGKWRKDGKNKNREERKFLTSWCRPLVRNRILAT